MTFKTFAKFVSSKKKERLESLLQFAGFEGDSTELIGRQFFISLIIALIALILQFIIYLTSVLQSALAIAIPLPFDSLTMLVIAIISSVVLFFVVSIILELKVYYAVEKRRKLAEAILPDFLLLAANSIRSGMTPFKAFRESARPEFGALSEEIKLATAKSLGTQSFENALKELSSRISSQTLKDSVELLSQSIRSGSHFAKLLETIAFDIRKAQELKKELLSSTRMYVLFIAFVVLIATPILLAISVQFLGMVSSIQAESLEKGSAGLFSFLASQVGISVEFMQNISIILLFGNALLASLFMGILSSERARIGLKFFPILFIVSLIVFWLFAQLLSVFFTMNF